MEEFKDLLQIDEQLESEIETAMKNYYGNRYYDEYSWNPVSGKEFSRLRELIFQSIQLYSDYKKV